VGTFSQNCNQELTNHSTQMSKPNMRLAPRLNRTNHQRVFHTTFDNQYGHKKTNMKYRNTNKPFPSALFEPILFFPANTPLISHLKHPLFQSLTRFTGIGFVPTKRNQFFFGGFSQQSSSCSPREGVETCLDLALNTLGQGYYGQVKDGREAKATHGTQVRS